MARTQIKLKHPITELELDLDENSLKLLEPIDRVKAEWEKKTNAPTVVLSHCTNVIFIL